VTAQTDDDSDPDVMTSSASKTAEEERLPVILEPPWLKPFESHQSAPLSDNSQLFPDSSAEEEIAEERRDFDDTGPGMVDPVVEIRMADEGPAEEEEWSWKYDEHGKKIWYRKSGTDGVQSVPDRQAGTIRFATRPMPTLPPPTSKPHGYWMVDDRGSYLWYRFVETGKYVRDMNVERISEDSASPDEQPRPREKLLWTGVGRYDFSQCLDAYRLIGFIEHWAILGIFSC